MSPILTDAFFLKKFSLNSVDLLNEEVMELNLLDKELTEHFFILGLRVLKVFVLNADDDQRLELFDPFVELLDHLGQVRDTFEHHLVVFG